MKQKAGRKPAIKTKDDLKFEKKIIKMLGKMSVSDIEEATGFPQRKIYKLAEKNGITTIDFTKKKRQSKLKSGLFDVSIRENWIM